MKRYIRSSNDSSQIPAEVRKYYKIDTSDMEDIDELAEEFAYDGLELLFTVEAKSRYKDIFDEANIGYASVCRRKDGSTGVFVLAGDSTYDISDPDKIQDIIRRVKDNRGNILW